MIRLHKTECPAVLMNNAASWLSDLEEAIASGNKSLIISRKSRYNHKDVKAAVAKETFGKCAYCEADVLAVSHGDIEHVYPKSAHVTKTFDWQNLGFACQKCNQNKSNKDPLAESILDPYNIDPEPFIRFFGAFVSSNATLEGLKTINVLDLERASLFERRQNLFKSLIRDVNMIKMARSEEEKAILVSDFERNELGDHLEFAAMRRDFWRAFKQALD